MHQHTLMSNAFIPKPASTCYPGGVSLVNNIFALPRDFLVLGSNTQLYLTTGIGLGLTYNALPVDLGVEMHVELA